MSQIDDRPRQSAQISKDPRLLNRHSVAIVCATRLAPHLQAVQPIAPGAHTCDLPFTPPSMPSTTGLAPEWCCSGSAFVGYACLHLHDRHHTTRAPSASDTELGGTVSGRAAAWACETDAALAAGVPLPWVQQKLDAFGTGGSKRNTECMRMRRCDRGSNRCLRCWSQEPLIGSAEGRGRSEDRGENTAPWLGDLGSTPPEAVSEQRWAAVSRRGYGPGLANGDRRRRAARSDGAVIQRPCAEESRPVRGQHVSAHHPHAPHARGWGSVSVRLRGAEGARWG
jgi:hypothetical protein